MTKAELVLRAREGDRDTFDLLITAVIDHLFRIARLILRDVDRAEDVVQEALVKCWRNLPALRDPARFDAWPNRLLLNSVPDEARRRGRFAASISILRIEPVERDSASALANRDELVRVFERLSLEHRTIVVLHHYLGFTVDEAASTIGIPVGTAKSRPHYATHGLRAALEADERIDPARKALA